MCTISDLIDAILNSDEKLARRLVESVNFAPSIANFGKSARVLELAIAREYIDIAKIAIARGCMLSAHALVLAIGFIDDDFDGDYYLAHDLLSRKCPTSARALEKSILRKDYRTAERLVFEENCPISPIAIKFAIEDEHPKFAQRMIAAIAIAPALKPNVSVELGTSDIAVSIFPVDILTEEMLDIAIEYGYCDLAKDMLAKGCPISTNALDFAILHDRDELIDKLISRNCSLTSDALESAICKEKNDLVKRMITAGCQISDRALELAICRNQISIIRLLLAGGCKVSKRALENMLEMKQSYRDQISDEIMRRVNIV